MELFRMAKPITKKSPASSPEDTVICDNCGFPIPKSQANKCSRCGAVLCDVCMAWHECEEHGTAEREPVKKTAGSKINHPAAVAGLLLLLLVLMAFIFGGYFMAINSMYPDFLKKNRSEDRTEYQRIRLCKFNTHISGGGL